MTSRLFQTVTFLLLAGLGAQVVLLSLQNRELKAGFENLSTTGQPQVLRLGSRVPSLSVESPSDRPTQLHFQKRPSSPTLLFFFRSNCPACAQTVPLWSELAQAVPASVRVAGLSSEPVEAIDDYERLSSPSYDLFAAPGDALRTHFQIEFVPQTMLIGNDGLVLGVWPGILKSEDLEAIQRMVHAYTPDLADRQHLPLTTEGEL